MCLGLPMKVVSRDGDRAVVKSDKTSREISLGLLKNVHIGDYVIVHAGFAIERLDRRRAKETLDIIREIRL